MWNFYEFYGRLPSKPKLEAVDIEKVMKIIKAARDAREARKARGAQQPAPAATQPQAQQPAPAATQPQAQQPAAAATQPDVLGDLEKTLSASPEPKAPTASSKGKPRTSTQSNDVLGDLDKIFAGSPQTPTSVDGPIAPDAERQTRPRNPRGKTTMTDRQIEKDAEATYPVDWPKGLEDYLTKNNIQWNDPTTGQPGSVLSYMEKSGKRPYITYPGRGGDASGGDETPQMFPVLVPKEHFKAAKRASRKNLRDKRADSSEFYDDKAQGQRLGRVRVGHGKRFQPLEVQLSEPEKQVWNAMARVGGNSAKTKKRPDGTMAILGKRFSFPELVQAVTDEMNARPAGGLGKKVLTTPEEVAPLVINILEKDRVPQQQGYGKRILQVSHKDDPKGNRLSRNMKIMQGQDIGALSGDQAIGANDVKVTLPFAPRGYDPNKEVQDKVQLPSGLKHRAGDNRSERSLGDVPGYEVDPLKQRIKQGLAKPRNQESQPDLAVAGYHAILQALDSGDHSTAMQYVDKLEQLNGDLGQVWEQIETKLLDHIDGLRKTNPKKAAEMEDNMLKLMSAIEAREGGTAVEHALYNVLENAQFRRWADFYNLMEHSGI